MPVCRLCREQQQQREDAELRRQRSLAAAALKEQMDAIEAAQECKAAALAQDLRCARLCHHAGPYRKDGSHSGPMLCSAAASFEARDLSTGSLEAQCVKAVTQGRQLFNCAGL